MPSQILIADDDEIARDVMAHLLTDRGHAVTVAGDGVDAVASLRRGRFDVAVLDYHLPLLDGVTAARRGGAAGGGSGATRFIGVTADTGALELRDAEGTIFDAIVQKPLHLPAFLQAVEASLAALRRSESARAVRDAWSACGFERLPRARFAGEAGPEWAALLGRAFDLTRPGNPDLILVAEGVRLAELGELRTEGNLFALPMVDVAGRWGRQADAVFDLDDPAGWDATAAAARGFAARRALLTTRFLSAATLPDKLLAYVFVSGRDFVPLDLDADEWTPTYPGFFPVRRVRDIAEKLAHEGLMSRDVPNDATPFDPPRFTLTPAALAFLTGDAFAGSYPRRARRA